MCTSSWCLCVYESLSCAVALCHSGHQLSENTLNFGAKASLFLLSESHPLAIILFSSKRSESAFSSLQVNSGWSLLNRRKGQETLHPSLDRHECCTALWWHGHTLHRGRNGSWSAGMMELPEHYSNAYQAKDTSLLSSSTHQCQRHACPPIYPTDALAKRFCSPGENTSQPTRWPKPVGPGSPR